MQHYTDRRGYNGIRAAVDWRFLASQPPGNHPFGAYFTTLPPSTKNLALRLRIPRLKTEFVFAFRDDGDIQRLPGGRGDTIWFSPGDYRVAKARQIDLGATSAVQGRWGSGEPQS